MAPVKTLSQQEFSPPDSQSASSGPHSVQTRGANIHTRLPHPTMGKNHLTIHTFQMVRGHPLYVLLYTAELLLLHNKSPSSGKFLMRNSKSTKYLVYVKVCPLEGVILA